MRISIALAAAAAAIATSSPALAAEAQQISVNGTGGASVPDGASDSQQQVAYDHALTTAISDAESKAHMVAQQLSLTLGAVGSFTEQSDDYLGYCGVGFLPGVASTGVSAAPAAPKAQGALSGELTRIPPKPKPRRKPTKHKTSKAHKAQTESCQLEADVTLVYAVS